MPILSDEAIAMIGEVSLLFHVFLSSIVSESYQDLRTWEWLSKGFQ